jgi:hypothetical protein
MATNSEFRGSGGYFWPRRLNRLAKLVGMIYIIYWDDLNVKGLDLHALWLSSCNFFNRSAINERKALHRILAYVHWCCVFLS